jgi:hypothetical protein
MVAKLLFDFWRFLLASQYESTRTRSWTLRRDYRPWRCGNAWRRCGVHRVTHHEPIHRRDLARDHADVMVVAGWTHPTVAQWIVV